MNKESKSRLDYQREYLKRPGVRDHKKEYYRNYYNTHKDLYARAIKKYRQTEKGRESMRRSNKKHRLYNIEYHRKRRKWARKNGICGSCLHRKAIVGKSLCEKCMALDSS